MSDSEQELFEVRDPSSTPRTEFSSSNVAEVNIPKDVEVDSGFKDGISSSPSSSVEETTSGDVDVAAVKDEGISVDVPEELQQQEVTTNTFPKQEVEEGSKEEKMEMTPSPPPPKPTPSSPPPKVKLDRKFVVSPAAAAGRLGKAAGIKRKRPRVDWALPPSNIPPPIQNPVVLPAQGFLSREIMLQLNDHITTGFQSIGSAFVHLRHAQTELYHARNLLDRIYRNQHGDFETFTPSQERSPDSRRAGSPKPGGSREMTGSMENVQVPVDPFQFMEEDVPVVPDVPTAHFEKSGAGRGGRGRGRGGRGGRAGSAVQRGRPRKQNGTSAYNSRLSKLGLKGLATHLSLLMEQEEIPEARKLRVSAVLLSDLGSVLKNREVMIKRNIFSSSKISALLERRETESPSPVSSGASTRVEDSDSGEM